MEIQFVASVAVIAPDPAASRALYMDALALPLKQLDGDYYASGEVGGCKHFGVWPLAQAAEACFGSPVWPERLTVPQVSLEFELADADSVGRGAEELRALGYELLHGPKVEPWGQTVARLLSPEGTLVGLSFAPGFHEGGSSG